jgi:signal transduction histidine kinase
MKNGKFNLNMQPTDIKKSIKELLEMFDIPAEEKGIQLVKQF